MSTDPLARVKRAARAKRRADAEYLAALVAAADAGASWADLAPLAVPIQGAGTGARPSRQAVRQLVLRARDSASTAPR